ncbi:MAG: hypothetical protein MUE46_13070 [Xanthomonadales bacterium]|jgi:hypothetical protein|nr:hypothetical protein [Xanthomonadales bacterium]
MKAHPLHALPVAQDRRYTCALFGLAAFGILALLVGLFLIAHAVGLGPLAASRKRPTAADATTLQPPCTWFELTPAALPLDGPCRE